jgi:hypothetical protein
MVNSTSTKIKNEINLIFGTFIFLKCFIPTKVKIMKTITANNLLKGFSRRYNFKKRVMDINPYKILVVKSISIDGVIICRDSFFLV